MESPKTIFFSKKFVDSFRVSFKMDVAMRFFLFYLQSSTTSDEEEGIWCFVLKIQILLNFDNSRCTRQSGLLHSARYYNFLFPKSWLKYRLKLKSPFKKNDSFRFPVIIHKDLMHFWVVFFLESLQDQGRQMISLTVLSSTPSLRQRGYFHELSRNRPLLHCFKRMPSKNKSSIFLIG